jgi:hypothetical protein
MHPGQRLAVRNCLRLARLRTARSLSGVPGAIGWIAPGDRRDRGRSDPRDRPLIRADAA